MLKLLPAIDTQAEYDDLEGGGGGGDNVPDAYLVSGHSLPSNGSR